MVTAPGLDPTSILYVSPYPVQEGRLDLSHDVRVVDGSPFIIVSYKMIFDAAKKGYRQLVLVHNKPNEAARKMFDIYFGPGIVSAMGRRVIDLETHQTYTLR